MNLTGQCEIDFEKWYIDYKNWIEYTVNEDGETDIYKIDIKEFFEHKDSMQYGVYVDFFDSVGIDIETPLKWDKIGYLSIVDGYYVNKKDNGFIPFKTRQEARIAAIKKANEIYNLN